MKTSLQRTYSITIPLALLTAILWAPASMADKSHEPGSQQQQDQAQVAQGAQYWSNQCQRCHNLRAPNEFTDDIWDVSVNHMRIRANIPAHQIRAIKAFLKSSN